MGPPDSDGISRAPPYSGSDFRRSVPFAYEAFTLCGRLSQHLSARNELAHFGKTLRHLRIRSLDPDYATPAGLARTRFRLWPVSLTTTRASLRFLLLRLLRCFTSPGLPPLASASSSTRRVAPFGYPRFSGCLLLPAAFRSLPRPSSAISAKASPRVPLNTSPSCCCYGCPRCFGFSYTLQVRRRRECIRGSLERR